MKSNRPVNLDPTTIAAVNLKSPIAIASIMHRISGIVIFPLIALLLYILQQSLASPQAFEAVKTGILGGFVGGGLTFIALAALLYHFVTGTKHLIQDFGIGESWETGRLFALTALAIIVVLIVLAFLWMVL